MAGLGAANRGGCASGNRRLCAAKEADGVTAPNGTTMGVMQPNDSTIFEIPYVSTLANVPVGTMVLVQYFYGMSNMIAVSLGDGTQPEGV